MNARVLLLVLVTALFMAAWDGDKDAMEAAIARRTQQSHSAVAGLRKDPNHRHLASGHVTSVALAQPVPVVAASSDVTKSVPMPEGIAAGEYQAVSQSGQTQRISVSAEKAKSRTVRDFYMSDAADGSRWYFVRINVQ